MKNIILGLLMMIGVAGSAQTVEIYYDIAGNQIKREICVCKNADSFSKEITELKNEDFQKEMPSDLVSFYPNPVKEQLYIKWDLKDEKKVTSVELYNLNGQKLHSYINLETKENQIVDFASYPLTNYIIIINYNNSEKKTLNIIKN